MIPTVARVNVPFRWSIADGLNGQSMIARSYGREIAAVVSRPSRKWVTDRNGLLVPYNANSVAVATLSGEPAALFEGTNENLCIRSDEFDTWTDVNSCNVSANSATAPDGTLTADTLTATATASSRRRTVTFSTDGEKSVAVYLRPGTSTRLGVRLRDTTAVTDRHYVRVTWNAGIPTLSTVAGGGSLFQPEFTLFGWRIPFSATGVVAANVNVIDIIPDDLAGTGTVIAWGGYARNSAVPGSHVPTAAGTVVNVADVCYFDFAGLNPPRAITTYVRGRELNRAADTLAGQLGIIQISDAAISDPYFAIINRSTSTGYSALHDPLNLSITGAVGTAVTRGDLLEFRAGILNTGAAFAGLTVNGSTEELASNGSAQAVGPAWSQARLYVNSQGSVNTGQFAYTHIVIAEGVRTLAEMRELAGV